ncbi:MAG: oligosaccharide flippase family protein [candidate division WOR-3 bacterium]|nr:oligosaccharide flippase family protein [candidate division WOR-3 bacterium]MDW8113650.1 oligosaccharide flippase family protein [candidate division WOR-3 bacterium]
MIAKNFLFLSFGEILGRFFSFLAIIYLTRKINLINFGEVNFALTYVSYFSLLTNFGLLIYGIRKIAQEKSIKEIVDKIFSFRLLLGILAFLSSILLIHILKEDIILKKLVLIYSFFILFDAINLEWFFLGKEKIGFCALNRFLTNFLYFLLLLIFLESKKEILFIPFSFILGNLFGSLMLLYFYHHKFNKISIKLDFKKNFFLLKETLPLGGAQILIQIYTLSGIIFLGLLKMKKELGYYSAGFRILLILMIFDRIFNQIILPFLTRKLEEGNFAVIKNITRLVLIFLLPFTFFLFIISDKLFLFLFPQEYLLGKEVFQILLGFFIFTFLNSIVSLSLLAIKEDRQYFKNILRGTLFNLFTIIILTKNFFHLGAALSLLLTEALIFFLNFQTLKSFYKFNLLSSFPLPLLFAFLTLLPIFFFKNLPLIILIMLFLITYFCLLMVFQKEIKKDYYLLK